MIKNFTPRLSIYPNSPNSIIFIEGLSSLYLPLNTNILKTISDKTGIAVSDYSEIKKTAFRK
ncbi:hypothetical protein MASR1M74_22580 [Lentimicrobium sp.]